jgi:heme exporter protein B
MTPSLRLEGIAAFRGDRLLFEAIDLALAPGDALLVTGPNGAGKSTLLRIVAGLLPALAGTVRHEGTLALATAEGDALDERRPLRAALDHWARLDGARDRLAPAMAAMAIAHLADVPVHMLSTGQRKRAVLARTIAGAAPIWLLDEPGNGLDADGLARLADAMAAHRAAGGIVIAASHQPLGLQDAHRLDLTEQQSPPPLGGRVRWGASPDATATSHPETPPTPPLPPMGGGSLTTLLHRDLRQHYGSGAALLPILFFLLVATLFPFAVGPDGGLLARTGGGALWMAALLAALLPVDRLIDPDRAAGIFDQYAVRGIGTESAIISKLLAHWLGFAPPLMLAVLPAAALLRLDGMTVARIEAGLALGTPGLAALGVLTAALTTGLRGAGALAGLVMLPLAIPLLIFGAGALGDGSASALKLLAATSLLLLAITPFAGAAAIRAGRT